MRARQLATIGKVGEPPQAVRVGPREAHRRQARMSVLKGADRARMRRGVKSHEAKQRREYPELLLRVIGRDEGLDEVRALLEAERREGREVPVNRDSALSRVVDGMLIEEFGELREAIRHASGGCLEQFQRAGLDGAGTHSGASHRDITGKALR